MSKKLKKGDRVTWNSPDGMMSGRIVDVRIKAFNMNKQSYEASKDEPRYIVETDNGEQLAHTADMLKRKG